MSVSVGIGYEIGSILTSGLSSVKLSIMTDSHHLRHRRHHSGDWDRVLSVLGNVVCRHDRSTTDYPHSPRASTQLWYNGDRLAKRCGVMRVMCVRIVGTFPLKPYLATGVGDGLGVSRV